MTPLIWLTLLVWTAIVAQSPTPGAPQDTGCLLPAEKLRLQTETKLDNRIKMYEAASTRCESIVQYALSTPTPPSITPTLNGWMQLLEASLKDIEQSADRKNKSKALIRYEIQLRKAISELQDFKMKGSYEQLQEIDAWTEKAENIRKKFVDILFQR